MWDGQDKEQKSVYVNLRWDCKWPLSTERNTFIRTRDPTHCCPLKSASVPHWEAYSKSHYGECSWTGRQTGSSQGSPPGGLGVLDKRYTIPLRPSASIQDRAPPGLLERPDQDWRRGWAGETGQGAARVVLEGPSGRLRRLYNFREARRAPWISWSLRVQAETSTRVNSISAERRHTLSPLVPSVRLEGSGECVTWTCGSWTCLEKSSHKHKRQMIRNHHQT